MNETEVYRHWKDLDIFSKSIDANKNNKTFVFYDGPPFMTGLPHYGHVLAGFIKDSVLRYAHEQGHNVPRFAGADCHGLPIEFEIEKELGIKTTSQVLDYGIGNYNEKCRSIVMRYSSVWEETMGRLGRWIDFKNDYKTMTKEFMNSTWWVFSELYKKNRIYEGVRVMPYSTSCGTPISNFETQQNFREIQDDSLFIKLPIQIDGFVNTWIMVWTTTPWTLPANYALCVNPEIDYVIVELDGSNYILANDLIQTVFKNVQVNVIKTFKGQELVGLNYTPAFTFNKMVQPSDYKIIAGSFVTSTDGTGVVHIAPSFGADDYNVCVENGLIQKDSKLFLPLDTNGYVTSDIPELTGTFYKNHNDKSKIDLNTWVIIQLKQSGYYHEKRQIVHDYPFCWRSETPLIYRAVDSWFVKVEDMREKLFELNQKINWVPDHVGHSRFSTWLKSAKDWGISRNRFWGTPIPIWKSPDGDTICVSSSYELEELAGLEPNSITDLHRHNIDHIKIVKDGKTYSRVDFVLDCWFESGSMPYGSINRVGIVELLKNSHSGIQYDSNSNPYIQTSDGLIHKILPADFIAEGLDQTRGWFYTLLVLSASLFNTIPFKNVIVNGLVLAEDGKKMSKSKKNYPDIMEIINEYGSDCLRLYLLGSPAARAEPLRFSKSGVHAQMKDIIIPLSNSIVFFKEYTNLYHKTFNANPIYNIENPENLIKISNPINNWILNQIKGIEAEYNHHMKNYDLNRTVNVLNGLVEILNNGYIKFGRLILKGKESNEEWIQGLSTFYYVIKRIILTFRAVMPFFCESQYLNLKEFTGKIGFDTEFYQSESVHLNSINEYVNLNTEQITYSNDFNIIYNMIKEIYMLRSSNNISLKKPIKSISLVIDPELDSKYSTRYRDYMNFVSEECNIMDLQIIDKSQVKITKTISPIKALIFKTWGKSVSTVFDQLMKMNSEELEQIIESTEGHDGFKFEKSHFNCNSKIEIIGQMDKNLTYREFKFDGYNLIMIGNLDWDEQTDKLYYYRLVATRIQRCRKLAGVHPWDPINSYYSGKPKYDLDSPESLDYINKITRIQLFKHSGQNVFFEQDFDDIELKICLEHI
jgi:isoleucyl-tRNA synthetase